MRSHNPFRPRLFYTDGPLQGEERPYFTVTPEEASTGHVLELRPGRPLDASVADDLMIAPAAPADGLSVPFADAQTERDRMLRMGSTLLRASISDSRAHNGAIADNVTA